MPYSNNPRIELTGQSQILEERLVPITRELNESPLMVNRNTWWINTVAASETANFWIDHCRHLAKDSSFRPNSVAECRKFLFTDWGREVRKTDKDGLLELANQGNSLAAGIISARSSISRWSQLKKWRPYAELGLVQAKWDSLGTPQGRYTSDNPCLNNRIVPIRETIEADPGFSFLSLDLKAAEYVVWASISGDPVLGKLFREGRDVHAEMATAVQKSVPSWDLRGEEPRAAGKTLNFALLYQMQPYTLSMRLGCSTETATKIINSYYRRAPVAAEFIRKTLDDAKANGYVTTYFGRKRYCPEYQNGATDREIHEIEKTCWNQVVAGTAAELPKKRQILAWEELRRVGFGPDRVRLVFKQLRRGGIHGAERRTGGGGDLNHPSCPITDIMLTKK
jgi:hypothetical protein